MIKSQLLVWQRYFASPISKVSNNKNEVKKTVKQLVKTSQFFLRVNLLQVCPSLPTLFCALLFIPSLNVLSDYFDVSRNLFAVPTVTISINFVTQLLKRGCRITKWQDFCPSHKALSWKVVLIWHYTLLIYFSFCVLPGRISRVRSC